MESIKQLENFRQNGFSFCGIITESVFIPFMMGQCPGYKIRRGPDKNATILLFLVVTLFYATVSEQLLMDGVRPKLVLNK